jgi:hypothetical protein
VLVADSGITRDIVARRLCKIFLDKSFIVVPDRKHEGGRHWELDGDFAQLVGLAALVVLIENLHVEARHGLDAASRESGEGRPKLCGVLDISADRPADLCLPPVIVDDNMRQVLVKPEDGVGVAALTSHLV